MKETLVMVNITMIPRKIDTRFDGVFSEPPVAGIDLMQAWNYVDLNDAGEEFLYNCYTSSKTFYKSGSRKKLEDIAFGLVNPTDTNLEKVKKITEYVSKKVPHAIFYYRDKGENLPTNRNLTEEQIIESGYGWCNEQARVFCCLTQIFGIVSRLVFAGNEDRGYGHTLSEVLIDGKWMMVDQSPGVCFIKDDELVRAVDVYRKKEFKNYFEPLFRDIIIDYIKTVPGDILEKTSLVSDNPLDKFAHIGVCNYFII